MALIRDQSSHVSPFSDPPPATYNHQPSASRLQSRPAAGPFLGKQACVTIAGGRIFFEATRAVALHPGFSRGGTRSVASVFDHRESGK